ncbi:hypothetical protein SASPL_123503 [Salvia splendens]|uniref:Uncharacterized protein n=1 Tax=Salvia splendens TaxID=180675 RepID=A0A8X8XP71_SALSN|nr:hypothetical protein SASPL_123503 [Salvia splendens]
MVRFRGKLIKGSNQAVKEGTTGCNKKDTRGYELDGAQHSVIKDNVLEGDGLVDNDSGIGSLDAHDEMEPTHAIAATLGMWTIAIKLGVLAVLSYFYGLSKECPYAFLDEFWRYCDIQPVSAGSTSEDYRLKAIPFVLKGPSKHGPSSE